jgi:hypothetical protein
MQCAAAQVWSADPGSAGRNLTLFLTGDWKVPRTRRLESLRYVARTFLSAGSGDFPVARRSQGKTS